MKRNTVRAKFLADWRKSQILLFPEPGETNEFTLLPMCWASRFSQTHPLPLHFLLPASTFSNEMWEMGQFTAEGCFFLRDRDIKMEYRGYAEVDEGVWIQTERKKAGKKKKEVARQESKMLALIWVSSLREDRSAWIAFLAFNFSYTKRDWSWGAALDLSNQLPWQELLRYSTSRNKRARQHGEVRYAQKVWQ